MLWIQKHEITAFYTALCWNNSLCSVVFTWEVKHKEDKMTQLPSL